MNEICGLIHIPLGLSVTYDMTNSMHELISAWEAHEKFIDADSKMIIHERFMDITSLLAIYNHISKMREEREL